MIELSAKSLDTVVVVMLGVATYEGIQIVINTFGNDRISNKVIKSKMVYYYGFIARA